ncbi:ATP-binding cassette domain-containing protein [Ligilactobacillus acidipiscis]|uniref:ATP-binding cassette domain-containing protein n=1 Tax=Ligilactobacillus acidipiscis TaxID=89059 RepID=UPI003869EE55
MAKIELKYITKESPLLIDKKERNKGVVQTAENDSFWQLRGISLDINDGEAVGLVGMNGSGKSSLLQIIAGLTQQTTGFITCPSRINLASATHGLADDQTGLENIRTKIAEADIDSFKGDHLTNGVINFCELGQWLYRPVSEYSIGMRARLSLGIALYIQPELVLIDDLFFLLDQDFFQKTAARIQRLKDLGVSFFISDSRGLNVEAFCERTVWLQFGEQQDFGVSRDVMQQYQYFIDYYYGLSLPEQNDYLAKKQQEQVDFDISHLYDEFKSEQFKQGYTRKDEPRMRKAFFVERGADPVGKTAKKEKTVNTESEPAPAQPKKSGKMGWIVTAAVILVFGGGWWFAESQQFSLSGKQASESSQVEKREKADSSSLAAAKKKSNTSSDIAASSAAKKQASEKKASSEKAASEKAASEKKASSEKSASSASSSSQEETQTVNVGDGETIGELAQKYATTVAKIQELNNMGSDINLTAGDSVKVPK